MNVESAVRHLAGAVIRPHREEAVVAREDETLLHEAVNLDFPAGDAERGLGFRLRRAKRREANEPECANC